MIKLLTLLLLFPFKATASLFGEENIPLMRLVVGQITELEELSSALGVAKDSRALLLKVNEGIGRVTEELDRVDEIVRRSKNLDPKEIKRISDITRLLEDTKALKGDLEAAVEARLAVTGEAVNASSLQGETAYSVGQDLIQTGAKLSEEVRSASPGRASQIGAAAQVSQMMATGTLLQSISQLTQLEAITLELKRGEIESELKNEKSRKKAARDFMNRRERE